MSEYRIASRYAKSLLELSVEQGKLEEVHTDMKLLSDLASENRDFVLMLKSPIVTHGKKLAILNDVFKGKVNELSLSIFSILTKKHREGYLPLIAKEFHHLYNVHKGIEEATVTTTFALDAKTKAEFEKVVKSITKKEVELTEVVDESLIGGFVLKIGDRQIDDSVSSRLRALKVDFLKNHYQKAY
ncbi:ATP synthase F1 subcomplex delta subunit [Roseivirga pacifica]|uniref:ATP synthase subunit delta n=1 Tax=Roseivirga pacifica TaxID=1267423 RepID=A0A1I0N238_9BACT|nr:ATP synthase F1 subunit delta [Roseivirga pacifica]MCO6359392.1 ATP synthase F1 subunit delta [Roseivirga pacifica]MCO6366762.1 ATP synthase F1 subunit delta [Roseivirga pacifica]MCO6370706.1 ATP synthase F1 subunit delta [Roseivirga pacifica]MCO6374418.1 ATP synthase F1 subunit delta [Roseivirga pacifica]MCO6379677.1 ATP synthase F1 subunit delta [Roseivirga pacifica]